MPTLKQGTSLARVDRLGAYIDSFQLSGRQILMVSPDGRDTHGGCAVLAPYANRVRNAVYVWNDRPYILPRNDGMNSIHGLVKQEKWSYDSETRQAPNITELKYDLVSPCYPSRIVIKNKYEIETDFFDVTCNVTNVGESSCPLVIGFHPYFLFRNKWSLSHENDLYKLQYKDSYFPSGEMEKTDFNGAGDLQSSNFDNTFFGGGKVTLNAGDHSLEIERRNMEYLVIYNGKYSKNTSVALEPMTGAPDAFNNRIGLVTLDAGKEFQCGFKVKLVT
ncbi:MAG: aldose 1-epimerase [Thermoplasmataceae archaeon]